MSESSPRISKETSIYGDKFKIASWNVNSLKVRLPHVEQWLKKAEPDILVLQETKTIDENFPAEEIQNMGYQVVFSGQKTYNGVAILCKDEYLIEDVVMDLPDLDDPQRRILAATINGIRILDLYVVNGSEVGSEKFEYKLHWLEKVTNWIEEQSKQYKKFVILGDFNIAPKDRDVHNPKSWHEKILCSTPERNALQKILDLGFADSFRLFEQEDETYSWWDYRSGGFDKNMGLRIDLVLSSKLLAEQCTASYVDPEPRGWERPSDHAPVVSEYRNLK
ncbi:exodeoxyribonuclease III [Cocleimonas flava]|uniref:Exodeoxyribonuclease-3 n=1 Tax=Cocleimonas flava TaxID=634765 RepID=A0A4V2P9D9_9GAMM|nr:exodeoxyribonuclease III [Cocleimonas flava]TCJ89195.1 exodeoxyribonuclease-3 [Cocleimonas flava]